MNSNGRVFSKAATKTGVFGVRDFVLNLTISALRWPRRSWRSSASSKVRRFRAFSALCRSGG